MKEKGNEERKAEEDQTEQECLQHGHNEKKQLETLKIKLWQLFERNLKEAVVNNLEEIQGR